MSFPHRLDLRGLLDVSPDASAGQVVSWWQWIDQAARIARVLEAANAAAREIVPYQEPDLVSELSGAFEMPMQVVVDVDLTDGTLLVYTPYDDAFLAGIKASIPPNSRWWDEERRCWCVAIDWTGNVQELLEDCFGGLSHHYSMRALEAIDDLVYLEREQELARAARRRESRRRRKRTRDPAPSPPPEEPPPPQEDPPKQRATEPDAYRVLGVTEDAPRKVVEAAYKAQATLNHPDTPDGSNEAMSRINAAYEEIKRRRR